MAPCIEQTIYRFCLCVCTFIHSCRIHMAIVNSLCGTLPVQKSSEYGMEPHCSWKHVLLYWTPSHDLSAFSKLVKSSWGKFLPIVFPNPCAPGDSESLSVQIGGSSLTTPTFHHEHTPKNQARRVRTISRIWSRLHGQSRRAPSRAGQSRAPASSEDLERLSKCVVAPVQHR